MRTVSEIRHQNFLMLFGLFKQQVWSAFPDQPERGMLRKMARTFDMSEAYLSHVKVGRKPIGHSTARQLEANFGLPVGWMDREHSDDDPRTTSEENFIATALMLFRMTPASAHKQILEMFRAVLQQDTPDHAGTRTSRDNSTTPPSPGGPTRSRAAKAGGAGQSTN